MRCRPISPAPDGADFRAESARIEQAYQARESQAFAELDALAESLRFRLARRGAYGFHPARPQGEPLTEADARALTRERRAEIDDAEQNCATPSPVFWTTCAHWSASATTH